MKNDFDISAFVNVQTVQSVLAELKEKVKTRRKEASLSQQELSVRSGVSFGSIRRFEKTGEIAFSSLAKIGLALNCLDDFNTLFHNPVITNLRDYKA
ncbi:MAG: helix-turn-helix domain-containing protein [Christensenellaceae bacterium]|jgi:transcriptional regulator with XRE-family HTH domain|nr:helix-turn-helix domain-containing protein [Christensenellaceae bacterium]